MTSANDADPIAEIKAAEERANQRVKAAQAEIAEATQAVEAAQAAKLNDLRRDHQEALAGLEAQVRQELAGYFSKVKAETKTQCEALSKSACAAMPKIVDEFTRSLLAD